MAQLTFDKKTLAKSSKKLKSAMNTKNKNLFIIFGSTSGIGEALYQYVSNFDENKFILINRRSIKMGKNVFQKLTIDLSKSLTTDKISKMCELFSQQNGYKNIYLILNAAVIDPIKRIGFADDELLLKAGYVNFLNYARIINVFISATHNLHTKKKILAISSGAADSPNIGLSSYCSTKAALEMFIKCLFLEQKIKSEYSVIALRPGTVDTNMQRKIRFSEKESFPKVDTFKEMFKQKKLLKPEMVAHKIYALLLSDKYWVSPVIDICDINPKFSLENLPEG